MLFENLFILIMILGYEANKENIRLLQAIYISPTLMWEMNDWTAQYSIVIKKIVWF